jgi:hypothetical protein
LGFCQGGDPPYDHLAKVATIHTNIYLIRTFKTVSSLVYIFALKKPIVHRWSSSILFFCCLAIQGPKKKNYCIFQYKFCTKETSMGISFFFIGEVGN